MIYVLDASAILAFLNAEQGDARVALVLEGALVSTVNVAEIVSKMVEKGAEASKIMAIFDDLHLVQIDFDSALAERSGAIRSQTKNAGLSLGDRACLALAERDNAVALTADRAWSKVSLDVDIEQIR